ncbi:MAG: RNA-binding protein [Endomicrobiales bacterium]|nr:RNA-binding protein [Endomicrobiales bacterium]
MNIYVSNIPFGTTEDEVHQMFTEFGQVKSTKMIIDKFTGQPRGFGFVEMDSDEEAKAAIAGLNGREVNGRKLQVNEARPRPERKPGGRGGFSRDRHGGGKGGFGGKKRGGGGYGRW